MSLTLAAFLVPVTAAADGAAPEVLDVWEPVATDDLGTPDPLAFGQPEGIAVAPDGSVFVSDGDTHVVRHLTEDAGVLLVVGGAGSIPGRFATPSSVAVSADGSFYVVDRGNDRIQRFAADGELLTTWGSPGSDPGEFDEPWGIAVAPDGSVYVAERGNHRVQRFDADGDFLTAWGEYGVADGQFDGARSVAVGGDGTVYVVDSWNDRVQRFGPDGDHRGTWGGAGDGPGEFSQPAAVAVAPDGSVYVTDAYNHRVQRFSAAGEFLSTWGSRGEGSGEFLYPDDLAVGPDGDAWVVDWMNGRVVRFTATGSPVDDWGAWSADGGTGTGTADARLLFDLHQRPSELRSRQGALLGSYRYEGIQLERVDAYPDDVQRFTRDELTIRCDGWSMDYVYDGASLVAGEITCPDTDPYLEHTFALRGIAVADNGAVSAAVQRVDARGVVTLDADGRIVRDVVTSLDGVDDAFWSMADVEVGPDGMLYVLDTMQVIEFDPYGRVFWSGTSFRIQRVAGADVELVAERADADHLADPAGLAVAPNGDLLLVRAGRHDVLRMDPGGEVVTGWGTQGTGAGELDHPSGIAIGPDARVYVADTGNDRIQVFDLDGQHLGGWGVSGTAAGSLRAPEAVATDTQGRVYVADTGNDRIEVFASDGTYLRGWGTPGVDPGSFDRPVDIEVAPDGSVLVADAGNLRIQRFASIDASPDDPSEDPPPDTSDWLFPDVPPDDVHAPGIAAILEAGITTGRTDGTFGPGEPLTRGQMATFLTRALDLG